MGKKLYQQKHKTEKKRQDYKPKYEEAQGLSVALRLSRIRQSFRPRPSDFSEVLKEV